MLRKCRRDDPPSDVGEVVLYCCYTLKNVIETFLLIVLNYFLGNDRI